MNLIVVGASYRSTSVALLERLSIPVADQGPALTQLIGGQHVAEAAMLSTCNRVEIYAAVPAFHAGLAQIVEALAQRAGISADELAEGLYVHHGTDAVAHVFRVVAGLDSMVVGEAQILGQLREAYAIASDAGSAGRLLHELLQQALRVGKRAHAETGIDAAPRNMVTAALGLAGQVAGARALVIGAGAMGSLAASALTRAGVASLAIANRDLQRARRLADNYAATSHDLADLPWLLEEADVVISATASTGYVLTPDAIQAVGSEASLTAQRRSGPLTIIDLAVPRDVAPGVGELPGVTLIDVERMAALVHAETAEIAAVESIVGAEITAFLGWLRGAEVAPTVAALRVRADELVAAELARLVRRTELSDDERAEVAHSMHRLVQRLLHEPTVRARQLAAGPDGEAYPRMLRELFGLAVPAETRVDRVREIYGPQIVGEA